jgi:hypothetical protein
LRTAWPAGRCRYRWDWSRLGRYRDRATKPARHVLAGGRRSDQSVGSVASLTTGALGTELASLTASVSVTVAPLPKLRVTGTV